MSGAERSFRRGRDRPRPRFYPGAPVEDATEAREFAPIAGRQSTDAEPGCFIGHREPDSRAVIMFWERGGYESADVMTPPEGTVVTGLTPVPQGSGEEQRSYTVEDGTWGEVQK